MSARLVLQRLKPPCLRGADVVAKATTYKDSGDLTHALKPRPAKTPEFSLTL